MREIKFRAWNGQSMRDVISIWHSYNAERLDHIAVKQVDGDSVDTWFADQIKSIMQYTGLKDKNGKEIFEGDIVSLDRLMDANWVIEYKAGEFYGSPLTSNLPVYLYEQHDRNYFQFEIIGNIYENPELFNSEQNPERSVATEDQSGNKS